MKPRKEIEGTLHVHSEMGSEGGDWAIMDKRCIFPRDPFPPGTPDGPSGVEVFAGWENGKVVTRQLLLSELPKESWSHDGLYILKDGDYLTIYDKQVPMKIVWEGMLRLRHYMTHAVATITSRLVQSDQEGVERSVWEKYFLEEHPAKLEKGVKKSRPRKTRKRR